MLAFLMIASAALFNIAVAAVTGIVPVVPGSDSGNLVKGTDGLDLGTAAITDAPVVTTVKATTTSAATTTQASAPMYCFVCRPIINPDTVGSTWEYEAMDAATCPDGRSDKVELCEAPDECGKISYEDDADGNKRNAGFACVESNIRAHLCVGDGCTGSELFPMYNAEGLLSVSEAATTKAQTKAVVAPTEVQPDCVNEPAGCTDNNGNSVTEPIIVEGKAVGSDATTHHYSTLLLVSSLVLLGAKLLH